MGRHRDTNGMLERGEGVPAGRSALSVLTIEFGDQERHRSGRQDRSRVVSSQLGSL
jgi:hypothetical protein